MSADDSIEEFKLERLRYLRELQQQRARLEQSKQAPREYMPGARVKQIAPDDPRHDCGAACNAPDDEWIIWLVMAGRGWGKSKVGSNWIVHQALQEPETEWAILAPTFRDVSKTCIEGTTGVLAALNEGELEKYRRNECVLHLTNGSKIFGYSADQPERIRGSNLWGAWCDELGSWRYEETWHEGLIPALRKGKNPRIVVTTTPRPTMLVRNLVGRKDGSVHLTRGSTWENSENLSKTAIIELKRRYEGTRIGRQELEGELLDDIEGALWQRGDIDATRIRRDELPQLTRVVVSIDPAVTSHEESDETGIVVCGEDRQGHGYVLADYSFQGSPNQVMQKAAWAYYEHEADRVIGEVNNGGDYIGNALHTVDPNVPYSTVRASRGKAVRAEPIAALYEQHRVHHLGLLAELEDQMCLVAGTLIETNRGQVPIDNVDVNDLVMTRDGWAPLIWTGRTGETTTTIRVNYAEGQIEATTCHRVYLSNLDEFVSASHVSSGDCLLVSHNWEPTVGRSRGVDAGTTVFGAVTSGTPGVNFSIEPSGKPTVETSRMEFSFTMSITTQVITGSKTSSSARPVSTLSSTRDEAFPGCRPSAESPRPRHSGVLGKASATSAQSAVTDSRLGTCAPSTARSTAVESSTVVKHERPVTVYNLSVADGYLPEYFANGVLTHNCTWVPGIGKSPDRVDALVWAMTELRGLSSGSWTDAYGIYTCEQCGHGFPTQVTGYVRTACPRCGTKIPD